MSMPTGLILPGDSEAPEVWESIPFTYTGSTLTMTANTALGARVVGLPRGGMRINRLAYLCVSAVGNVEMLVTKSTAKNGLVMDAAVSSGAVAASGSNALQELTISEYQLINGDTVWINPSGALQVRNASTYATVAALKNRLLAKASTPHPWSGQLTVAGASVCVYVAAYYV